MLARDYHTVKIQPAAEARTLSHLGAPEEVRPVRLPRPEASLPARRDAQRLRELARSVDRVGRRVLLHALHHVHVLAEELVARLRRRRDRVCVDRGTKISAEEYLV